MTILWLRKQGMTQVGANARNCNKVSESCFIILAANDLSIDIWLFIKKNQ